MKLTEQLQNLAQKYQAGGEIKPDQYRPDGTMKGKGFTGVHKSNDGKDVTEYSIGVKINGLEMDIPTMVPGLTEEEIQYIIQGGDMSAKSIGNPIADSIAKKASAHAQERLKNGKSVYAQPDEYQVGGRKSMDHSYDMGDINGFFRKMINAPWYRERLEKNGYNDPNMIRLPNQGNPIDQVIKNRNNNLNNINFDISEDESTSYNPYSRILNMKPSEINRLKAHPRSVGAHEVSHAIGNYLNIGRFNRNEANFIKSRINSGKDERDYVTSPNEAKADIDAMRYNLYKAGKFDPSTGRFQTKDGKFDPDLLELLKNDYQTKRMREVFSDKSLKEMFDTLAKNDSEQTVSYAQVGGQTPSTQEDWKQKYSTNPYFKDREDWGESLDKKFPNAKNTVRQSIYAASKRTGIDPGLLYTSAMEEGMKLALTGQDSGTRRAGYVEYQKSNPKGAKEYPIDGGYYYGLNTFSDKYGRTIKPSDLPRGFKYAPYDQKGADGTKAFTSAAFRSHDDAISAKAAMMKQVQGAMTYRLKENKLDLSPEARKFFDMVGYNMGEDKTIDMIKSYQQKGYLKDDRFLDPKFQPASWKEPYTNVQRRYQNYRILNEQKYFDDYESLDSKSNVAVNQNLQLGGTTDTLDGTKEWWDRYVNSPKYKERLQKEFPKYSESEIDSELAARKLNLDRTYPIVGSGDFDDPGIQGYAQPPERDQRQSSSWKGKIRNFIEDSVAPSSRPVHIRNGSDTGVYTHEISHSVDEGGRRIPDKTIGNILQRVRGVEPIKISNNDGENIYYDRVQNEDTIKALQNTDNFYQLDNGIDEEQAAIYPNIKWKIGGDKTEYSPKFGYRSNPTEILARLQSLRKDMYRKGAHDSANEDINTEQLQNYLDQVFQGDDEINTDLLDLLNEVKSNVNSDKDEIVENLRWMLNNIAKNDYPETQQVKQAQKGGMIRSELDSLSTKYKSRPSTTR